MYSMQTRVRFSETNADGKLSLTGLINYFQDCATLHGIDVGLAYTDMRHEGLAWVLMSWQIEIYRMPEVGESIDVITNPYRIGGFTGLRNFWINDIYGNRLCLADSIWALLDTNTGRPTHVKPEYGEKYGLGEKEPFTWRSGALRIDDAMSEIKPPVQVQPYMLDINDHVNNAWYPHLSEGYLPRDFNYSRIAVEYKTPARRGEAMHVRICEFEDGYIIGLISDGGSPYAISKFMQ